MNLNKFLGFLLYIVSFIILLKLGDMVSFRLQDQTPDHWPYKRFYYIFSILHPFIIGLIFAVPHFLSKTKQSGVWTFDWIIFLAICIPALYALITPWIPKSLYPFWPLRNCFSYYWHNITAIIFGYFFLESFKKNKPVETFSRFFGYFVYMIIFLTIIKSGDNGCGYYLTELAFSGRAKL
ncbi:hypothetical protein [Thermosyntropha sp.]|uniref:hypothetical protein n=1 Tax=Thermosyntropha sp. TaxID=2740820 RepID=UPI0025EE3896|nr:hypothetical protein [Thermosyntropha sp.]MBO8158956.1 hypothetical protein [Thermosyntropha sp.]